MADWMRAATGERSDLADFLQALTDEEWASPSLCEGWSVHDVVAHLVSYEQLGYLGVAAGMVRAGFRLNRLNQIRLDASRGRDPGELIAFLRAHLTPKGLTAGAGGRIGLTDGLIHHQDIRRALGRPREVPIDRLVVVLPYSLKAPCWHPSATRPAFVLWLRISTGSTGPAPKSGAQPRRSSWPLPVEATH